MCGIAGMVTRAPVAETEAAVGRMVHALRRRGPDGRGVVCVTGADQPCRLVLGHARLAILDLTEQAAQPMGDPETGSWIVYNGEIYNFRQLRAELAAGGRRFRSSGDTEVLLKALIVWGVDALPRLRGMYAFAFWDGRRRELWLGRDPLGIKPLLIGRRGDTVVFASELRAVQAAGAIPLTVNPAAVTSYLVYGMTVEPSTIAAEVLAVPPGHVVHIDADGRVRPPRKVWVLDTLRPEAANGTGGGVAGVAAAVARSVGAHLVSDAPVGVFLSGGTDSTVLATLAARGERTAPLHLLTVDFREPGFSEAARARAIAAPLAADHHVIAVGAESLRALLPAALDAVDQPTVDGFNTFAIAHAAAAAGIKVLLSGIGGDEVFGGYTTFQKAPLLARYRSSLARLGTLGLRTGRSRTPEWRKLAVARGVCGLPGAYLLQRAIRWHGAHTCVPPAAVPPAAAAVPPETWDALAAWGDADDVYRVSYLELAFYARNQLLRDADVFGGANSVEIRVPFLDLDLIQRAWSLPASAHVSPWGRRKKALAAVLRGIRPDLPAVRGKMGFVVPLERWLRGPLFERVADTLSSRRPFEALGLDRREAAPLLQSLRRGEPPVPWMQAWSLFVLLDWQDRWGLSV